MRYDLKKIMKRAWEIKRQHDRNIFSECLKEAWKEAKESKVVCALSDKEIVLLKEAGFKYWNKAGYERLYIDLGKFCLEKRDGVIYLNGKKIKRYQAEVINSMKYFVDVKTREIHVKNCYDRMHVSEDLILELKDIIRTMMDETLKGYRMAV